VHTIDTDCPPGEYLERLRTADMSAGVYALPAGGTDTQNPHAEDEVYIVLSGRASMVTPSGAVAVAAGKMLFVPAGEKHHFTDITEDLLLAVVFAPPYGSRQGADG
jgi:mannose-6-phosphate isomerase-like protein (cupin superfamily)